jgi:hypothetical protein
VRGLAHVRYDSRHFVPAGSLVSRSLLGFILFCALLLAGAAGLVWYVGPTLAAIAFDGTRRDAPYFVLHVARDLSGTGVAETAQYQEHFHELAAFDGAKRIWQAAGVRLHEARVRSGRRPGSPDLMEVFAFPKGSDVVQMMTTAEVRRLLNGSLRETLLIGTRTPPHLITAGSSVIVLYQAVEDAKRPPFGEPGRSGWLAALEGHQGHVAWDAPIEWLRGRERWNRVMWLEFSDPRTAAGWLRDPATVTGRAIASRYLGDVLVLVALPAEEAER